jgi:hypothetical protein
MQKKYTSEVTTFLGKEPKDIKEYDRALKALKAFGKDKEERKTEFRKQRTRHMNHTGPANISRRPCIYCEQEKS